MTHELGNPWLYLVEWRAHTEARWRFPTTFMQDSVFADLNDARHFACAVNHGESRVRCFKLEATEYEPVQEEILGI